MHCLVTGATGFIGRRLVCRLNELGHEVTCLVRQPLVPQHAAIKVITGNLLDDDLTDVLDRQAGQIDMVFHAGAMLPSSTPSDPGLFLEANGTGTMRLLEFCRRRGISRVVYFSSISVVGAPLHTPVDESHPLQPSNPYSLGKLVGELACNLYRSAIGQVASFRVTSPYGPGMALTTVLPRFVGQARRDKAVKWYGSGARSQDFIHVDDIAAACVWALENRISGTFNLASGKPVAMRELSEIIAANVAGARAMQAEQLDTQEDLRWEIDIAAARQAGFEAKIALEDGLVDYVRSVAENRTLLRWWR
jgi:UDP-glucose 4-epimerase